MEEGTLRIVQTIGILIQSTAIIVGGIWAYYRLWKERPYSPRIKSTLDFQYFGKGEKEHIATFQITVQNFGSTEK